MSEYLKKKKRELTAYRESRKTREGRASWEKNKQAAASAPANRTAPTPVKRKKAGKSNVGQTYKVKARMPELEATGLQALNKAFGRKK